ncbi:hypothetical protein QBC35DRAFT_549412 [Podospora australis]|uniref:Uncharacterized protein n=1 Tax=Podospora australis TaxID=1536484 RepID=A0AAN7AJM1_9PEZI|nr:hypothetical protein QBC35DRAFT_549412 [Podospora australis]
MQSSVAASKLDKQGQPGACPRNLHHWTYGRPRAVTLGQGGGWILYREEQSEVSWGGKNLPLKLREALAYGKRRKLIINQAVLNPHHAREYVLAYNDGSVYYSFHEDFQKDFDRIARQWCGDRVQYQPNPDLLRNDDYPGVLVSDNSDSETEQARRPEPPRQTHRSARPARHIRVPTMTTNGRQTPSREDVTGSSAQPWDGQYQQPQAPASAADPIPPPAHPGYAQPYSAYPPYPYTHPQYGPPPGWMQPPYTPMPWGPFTGYTSPSAAPPPHPHQQAAPVPPPNIPPGQDVLPVRMPRPLFDPYTGKSIYVELGPQNQAEPDSTDPSRSQPRHSMEGKGHDQKEEEAEQDRGGPSSGARPSKQDKGFKLRKPWKRGS